MTFSDNNRLMRQPHFLAFHSTFDTIFIAVGGLQKKYTRFSFVDALFSFWGVSFSFKIDIIKNLLSRTLQISWNRNFVKFGAL